MVRLVICHIIFYVLFLKVFRYTRCYYVLYMVMSFLLRCFNSAQSESEFSLIDIFLANLPKFLDTFLPNQYYSTHLNCVKCAQIISTSSVKELLSQFCNLCEHTYTCTLHFIPISHIASLKECENFSLCVWESWQISWWHFRSLTHQ